MAICRDRYRKISIQEEDVRLDSEIRAIQQAQMPGLVSTSSMKTISMKRTKLLLAIVIGGTGYTMKVYCKVLESGQ